MPFINAKYFFFFHLVTNICCNDFELHNKNNLSDLSTILFYILNKTTTLLDFHIGPSSTDLQKGVNSKTHLKRATHTPT